jgi:hypothetical protein
MLVMEPAVGGIEYRVVEVQRGPACAAQLARLLHGASCW